MISPPQSFTRTDTLFPDATLFRSTRRTAPPLGAGDRRGAGAGAGLDAHAVPEAARYAGRARSGAAPCSRRGRCFAAGERIRGLAVRPRPPRKERRQADRTDRNRVVTGTSVADMLVFRGDAKIK